MRQTRSWIDARPESRANPLLGRFLRGFTYPMSGFKFMGRHRLWSFAVWAVAVNVIFFVLVVAAIAWGVWPWLSKASASLSSWVTSLALSETGAVSVALSVLFWFLAGMVVLVVSSVVVVLLGQTVASPWLDALSERIEGIVLGSPVQSFSVWSVVRSIVFNITDLLWSLVILFVVHIPIFVVSFIPGFGTLAASGASLAFGALVLAVTFIGLPQTRRFVPYRDRLAFVWRHRALSLGFGSSAMLLLLVPGLNLLLLVIVVAGGTLAFCDLESSDQVHR